MSLDATNFDPGDTGLVNCDLPSKPTKCEATVGEQFDIIVDVNAIKAPYDIISAEINLGGLIFKPATGTDCDTGVIKEVIWPDYVGGPFNCLFFDLSGNVAVAALAKGGKSGFLGPIVKFNVACPATPGSHKVTLVPLAAAPLGFGTFLQHESTGSFWFPKEQVPGSEVDSLKINCVGGKSEININPVQKAPGPPPFGCYRVLNDLKESLFTVCDNNIQVGFPQEQPFLGLCDIDGTTVCEDSDPAKGKIRVSVVSDNYNVVESKPPPNYDPTNTAQQPCDVKTQAKCELTFQNTAVAVAWFPEDVDGNGRVALGDFLRVLQVFGQPKPQ